jgi:hypothetical protein
MDDVEMPDDIERDASNEGVQADPRSRGRDIAP